VEGFLQRVTELPQRHDKEDDRIDRVLAQMRAEAGRTE